MLYFEIFKFKFLRFLTYPLEIAASVIKRLIEIIFLVFFWSLVIKSSQSQIEIREIASYFLIALAVGDLVMARWGGLGSTIGRRIKYGEMSKFMIKPIDLIPHLYASTMGTVGMRMILSLVYFIVGIAINPPTSILGISLFVLFFINAFVIAFAFNIILGAMYFHLSDASGIKNSIEHMSRVLSGALVPIYFFPEKIKYFVKLTPFPSMIYGPTNALTINSFNNQVVFDLGVAFFWSITFTIFAYYFWSYSIKRYEAVGI